MRMQNRQSEQSQKALAQIEGVDSDIQYVIAMDASCLYIYIYVREAGYWPRDRKGLLILPNSSTNA
jgi:hypothetical protein